MRFKTLITGLGTGVIFLAGFCLAGNANASFTHPFHNKTDLFEQKDLPRKQKQIGANVKEGFSTILLASRLSNRQSNRVANHRRNSVFRAQSSRRNRPHGRSNYSVNRQSNPRFIQRNSNTKFTTAVPRGILTRKRTPNKRSSVQQNNFRDRRNVFQRPNSRKVQFITPRSRAR